MSLQNKLRVIQNALVSVTANTFHYWRAKAEPPYLVWAEDGEDSSFHSGNHTREQQIHGTADYFTKEEFDPTLDEIQTVLNSVMLGWRLNSVQYEEETGLIHYEWEWWVA